MLLSKLLMLQSKRLTCYVTVIPHTEPHYAFPVHISNLMGSNKNGLMQAASKHEF